MKRPLHVLMLACSLLASACSPLYVLRAGLEEAKILSRRRPIQRVIEDPATAEETRRKLRLVLQARDYAAHALDLDAGDSYTTYSYVDSDTLLMVVSAAHRDRFRAYTWWFPIVGHVPYKGFFRFGDAHREAERLEREGYDVYVRPSGAFSTLGWFNDPLLNTVLRYDDVSIATTVIHEILHNTFYLPSRVSFNESFANFVGERGAIEFFCGREGEQSAECGRARDSWADNLRYGEFLSGVVAELERLYDREDLDRTAKLELREEVFARAKQRFREEVAPGLRTAGFTGFLRRPLNNATLIGSRLYYDRLHAFEAVHQRLGGSLRESAHMIIRAAQRRPEDPYAALAELLGPEPARPPASTPSAAPADTAAT